MLDEADRMMEASSTTSCTEFLRTGRPPAPMAPRSVNWPGGSRRTPRRCTIALSKPAEGVDQQAYVIMNPRRPTSWSTSCVPAPGTSIIVFAGRKVEVRT